MKTRRATSVTARVTLFTLVIVLAGSVASGWYVSRLLRQDMEDLLKAQQFAYSRSIATEIERHISERLKAVEQVALMAGLQADLPQVAQQTLLDKLPVFQNLFTGGAFITDTLGAVVASTPVNLPRTGQTYYDRDYVIQVLATGRPYIGKPVKGRSMGVPVVVIAAPIRDGRGEVRGVLAGVINLNESGFLDAYRGGSLGRRGTFLLVSARDRLIVTSSNPDLVMGAVPPRGTNPQIDRFVEGWSGTALLRTPEGEEVLSSINQVPVAQWYVAVALPTSEAFAPALELERRLLVVTALLALLTATLVGLMIRRQLRPLQTTARSLARLTSQDLAAAAVTPLPVEREDEIGQLLHAFNELLAALERQRSDLARSELLYSTAFRTSPDAFSITRVSDGTYIAVNDSFTRMLGWTEQEAVGRPSSELRVWRDPADRQALVEMLAARGRCEALETVFLTRDGHPVNVQIAATPMRLNGTDCLLAVAHDITSRKQAQRQIETLAFTDPLTGLPNRRLFMDRLHQALPEAARHGLRGALLFIDLDDFKVLNDNQGHDQGDLLLRSIARRLESALRAGDTVARLGGDEFVVLLKDLAGDEALAVDQARHVGEKLLGLIAQPAILGAVDYHGTASMGVALFGAQGDNPTELLKRADLAMYHAKGAGRGMLAVFDPQMQALLTSRADLEASLRAALDSDQFALHYQVQVDAGGAVTGVESLLRWFHPARGAISPGEFIPVAERTGLIVALGDWALATACRQLADWSADPALAGLSIAVNVSSRQFQQDDFVDKVLACLDAHGADPRLLKLELTESVLVDSMDTVAERMKALKARGVKFSLDDFGTGFSSLAYLKRLPLDELKIDQGFVRDIEADPNDLAIAGTVVALGRSLGLQVVAEGVETEAQRAALAGVGCVRYQGYLFGRPLPLAQVEALVRARAPEAVPAA